MSTIFFHRTQEFYIKKTILLKEINSEEICIEKIEIIFFWKIENEMEIFLKTW